MRGQYPSGEDEDMQRRDVLKFLALSPFMGIPKGAEIKELTVPEPHNLPWPNELVPTFRIDGIEVGPYLAGKICGSHKDYIHIPNHGLCKIKSEVITNNVERGDYVLLEIFENVHYNPKRGSLDPLRTSYSAHALKLFKHQYDAWVSLISSGFEKLYSHRTLRWKFKQRIK